MRRLFDPATVARFWAKVNRGAADACWLWVAGCFPTGYGMFNAGRIRGRQHTFYAHRAAYFLTHGTLPEQSHHDTPDGLVVMHVCNTKRCCNPAHLRLGTQRENAEAAAADGLLAKVRQGRVSDEDVRAIRALRASGLPLRDVAARFGIGTPYVSLIANRRSKAAVSDPS